MTRSIPFILHRRYKHRTIVLPDENGIILLRPGPFTTPILSGDEFSMRNIRGNPRHKHLIPDPALLDLVFHVHKLCRLAGDVDWDFGFPLFDDQTTDSDGAEAEETASEEVVNLWQMMM